jgi:TonB-linked SusC/RagA family outer membrane protein
MKFLPNLGGAGRGLSGFVQRRSTMIFIMRVSVFYVALLSGSIQLLLAHPGSGQKLDETYVTVELNNESLQTLFSQIEKQTDLLFTFPEAVKGYTGFDLPKGERSVKETLEIVLEGTPITFRQINSNLIAVFVGAGEGGEGSGLEGVILGGRNEDHKATVFTVTGTVTDGSTQEALAGVNVIVKGTTRGTATDAEGKFAIDATEAEVLVFSFIGFKTFEAQVSGRSVIDVAMEADITALQAVEVRSTGYWTETKERSTSNISKVEAKDIENQPVTSPLMALQGRMPGVDITPYNGAAGAAIKIQIRGQNSLRATGGYPLFIIDGVPIDSRPLESYSTNLLDNGFDPLSGINPANIESIEVLKDGVATSIYGSRGANGVVRITTKQGVGSGRTNVDVNFYTGVGKITNRMDLLNTSQYLQMRKEAFANDNKNPGLFDYDVNGAWDTTRYTDWQDELLGGTAGITDIQAGVSGGNRNTTFRLGGGFHKENVVYSGDFGYQRINGDFSLRHTSNDQKFIATLMINYGANKNRLFDDGNFVRNALTLSPNAPKLYDAEGNLNWEIVSLLNGAFITNSWTNPLSYLKKTHSTTTSNLVANSTFSYEVLPGLILKTSLGFTELNSKEHLKYPIAAQSPTLINASSTGSAIFGSNDRKSWIVEPQVIYSQDFGHHSLNGVLGMTMQGSNSEYQSVAGSGYPSDVLLNTTKGASVLLYTNDGSEYRYAAFFARIGYDWKDKYLIDLTARRDGSSRFGPGNRFGNFGAIGAAWIFSKESLIQDHLKLLSFGKIRGSYGTTGNDQIGDYMFYNTYGITENKYANNPALYPDALYNPTYQWEVTKKLEAGIELGFAENRISLEASWYRNRSSNQLIDYLLPGTAGFSSMLRNFNAVVENSGVELVMTTVNINTEHVNWTTSVNASVPRNKLVEFPNIEETPYNTIYKVGEPLSIQRIYKWNGINPQSGLHEILDLNENGELGEEDKLFLKPLGRKYFGGIMNTVRYKSIELSFLIQFSKSVTADYLPINMPGRIGNQPVEVLDRWKNEGDITDVAKFSQLSANNSSYANEVRFSDRNTNYVSFARLKTLSLSYLFPSALLNKAKIYEAKIYLQAQNLFTITKYPGLDPETGNNLPPLTMMSVGVQVKL